MAAEEIVKTWDTKNHLMLELTSPKRSEWVEDWLGDAVSNVALLKRMDIRFLDANGQEVQFPMRLEATYHYHLPEGWTHVEDST